MKIAKLLRISGRVQGVSYRDSMRRKAYELGVTGWVRNRYNGDVEAYVCGDKANVDALCKWTLQGPPLAHVAGVEETAAEVDESLTDFERKETE